MAWEYTKQFWIKKIKEALDYYKFPEGDFSVADWEDNINRTTTYQTLDELGRKLRKETASKAKFAIDFLTGGEEEELSKATAKDIITFEAGIDVLKDEYKKAKSSDTTHEDEIREFRKKIKAIIGSNDLTNWESKIVKAGSGDKDITDLQKKISDLTTAKDNLDQQLKDKQQQILDHRCDSPNNAELNQTKQELDKANQEIISLKEQLGQKPNLPNDKEEDKKEEQENNNLTLEQLKTKLKTKQEEIKSLRIQLQKSRDNHHNSYSFGTLFVVGVVGLLFGSLIMFVIKKKKKKQ